MHKKSLLIITLLTTLLVAATAYADGKRSGGPTISAGTSYTASGDVGDGTGSFSTTSGTVGIRWGMISLNYTRTAYDWDKIGSLPFGNGVDDPWEALNKISLGARYRGDITDKWFYTAGVHLTSMFEEEMSNSFGAGVNAGVGYKWSDSVSFMLGAMVMHNGLETSVMPTVMVRYDDRAEDGSGFTGALGMPTNISYHFDKKAALRFALRPGGGGTYRLADNSKVAEAGYLKVSGWKAGLYYDWKPTQNAFLSVGPEYVFSRSLETYDRSGNKLHDESVDGAFGATLHLGWRF